MRSPLFAEVWGDIEWADYQFVFQPKRSRAYFKMRSAIRMAIWIPITVVFVYELLAIVSVYS